MSINGQHLHFLWLYSISLV